MDRLSINLSDYAKNGNGFGGASQESVDALNKALAAGQITGRDTADLTTAGGAPLKVGKDFETPYFP